jgi:hypothetical protein
VRRAAPDTQGPSSQATRKDSSPCTACIRLVERDRKSIVTLTRTTNPSISLALHVPCMSEGREEMQGPRHPGPSSQLLE